MSTDQKEALLKEYGEVVNTFRMLTEIRFKLLAFLPFAAGVATAVLARGEPSASTLAFSIFGFVVTIGLVTYNMRNDQLYDTLVARASAIERTLGIPDGAFANRPRPWLRLVGGAWKVDHRTAVAAIYGASLGLWLFVVLDTGAELAYRAAAEQQPPIWVHLAVLATAVGLMVGSAWLVHRRRKYTEAALRGSAKEAVDIAKRSTLEELTSNASFQRSCAHLGGINSEQVATRMDFLTHLESCTIGHYVAQGAGHWTAAQTVAAVTDLPPEWLYDCAPGRRGGE
jgi:hypothetical protein